MPALAVRSGLMHLHAPCRLSCLRQLLLSCLVWGFMHAHQVSGGSAGLGAGWALGACVGCEPDWCGQLYWPTQTVWSATWFWQANCVLAPVCLCVACQCKKAWQILWVLIFTGQSKASQAQARIKVALAPQCC